jgi:hypothetical protein
MAGKAVPSLRSSTENHTHGESDVPLAWRVESHTMTDDAVEGADTFGVGIYVTDEELRVVVWVPSEIDSGWTSQEQFQSLVQQAVWDHLDQEETLRAVAATTAPGETAELGTVTLQPSGNVVETSLEAPEPN